MISNLKVGEYTIRQEGNYDVSIWKDGRMVAHAIRHELCGEEKLLEILKAYKEIRDEI